MIRKEQGFEKGFDTVFLYHHLMGEEIQCPDSKTLRDIFGEQYENLFFDSMNWGPIQLTFKILTKNITKILTTTVQNRPFSSTLKTILLKILTKLKFIAIS